MRHTEDKEDAAEDSGEADYMCRGGPTIDDTLEDMEDAAGNHGEDDYYTGGPANNN